jgi:hypothetical protein
MSLLKQMWKLVGIIYFRFLCIKYTRNFKSIFYKLSDKYKSKSLRFEIEISLRSRSLWSNYSLTNKEEDEK